MSDGDLTKTLLRTFEQSAACERKIVQFARTLIPALKDAGRAETAKELEVLYFELDAIEGETVKAIAADPVGFLAFIQRLGRPGGR